VPLRASAAIHAVGVRLGRDAATIDRAYNDDRRMSAAFTKEHLRAHEPASWEPKSICEDRSRSGVSPRVAAREISPHEAPPGGTPGAAGPKRSPVLRGRESGS